MASLQDIRRRIKSVKNTQQVTKAMKMISAVKLRKSKERLSAFNVYSDKITQTVYNVVNYYKGDVHSDIIKSPIVQAFLSPRSEKKIRLVVIASDKGLCGGFNTNILKKASSFINEYKSKIVWLDTFGKRTFEWASKNKYTVDNHYFGATLTSFSDMAKNISSEAIVQYEKNFIDGLYVLYNRFDSVLVQTPVVQRIFPINQIDMNHICSNTSSTSYLLEPNPNTVLSILLSRFIETIFLKSLLESFAGEHGARMAAMDKASINAEDMINRLTLNMNKVRQAAITNQIIEIVSGANS